MRHSISLPAIGKEVYVGDYIKGIKLAKACPDSTFKHGLETWTPCTGAEIIKQFYHMVQDHCNRGLTIHKSRYDKWIHSFVHGKKHGRRCKNCGSVFFPKQAAQFYCSEGCHRDYVN